MNLNFPLYLFQKAGGKYPLRLHLQTAAQKSQRVAPAGGTGMPTQPRTALSMQAGFTCFFNWLSD